MGFTTLCSQVAEGEWRVQVDRVWIFTLCTLLIPMDSNGTVQPVFVGSLWSLVKQVLDRKQFQRPRWWVALSRSRCRSPDVRFLFCEVEICQDRRWLGAMMSPKKKWYHNFHVQFLGIISHLIGHLYGSPPLGRPRMRWRHRWVKNLWGVSIIHGHSIGKMMGKWWLIHD